MGCDDALWGVIKATALEDGVAFHQLDGGVKAYRGDDG